ncbi:MAG: acetate kinase, partial [Treponema sp.]|nr:acetate kinase [Treponema sp.]
MKILACNAGSTSLKFKLFNMPGDNLLAEGRIERVGSRDDAIFRYLNPQKDVSVRKEKQPVPDYTSGIKMFLEYLTGTSGAIAHISEIEAVCFKTVLAKGFYNVHYLTGEVMHGMQEYMDIAGSHNGPYISAINEFKALLPGTPMVGVFETAFHQTIPLERQLYGIPYEWYTQYGIRRMGYHGASHGYVSSQIRSLCGNHFRLISCHLGGSGSICAVLDGKSVDNSFGFSLHTGIMHAARVGDVDTSLFPFLMNRGLTPEEIMKGLTKQGGVLGISGISEDMRYVEQAAVEGNKRALLAIDVYCSHLIHYIG